MCIHTYFITNCIYICISLVLYTLIRKWYILASGKAWGEEYKLTDIQASFKKEHDVRELKLFLTAQL